MILSQKTLEELRAVITGDSEFNYRSGPKLVEFFNRLGFQDSYYQGFPSRNAYALERVEMLNGTPEIGKCIQMAFDPIEYVDNEDVLERQLQRFNKFLAFDGWKIICENDQIIKIVSTKQVKQTDSSNKKKSSATIDEFLQIKYDVDLSSLGIEQSVIEILNSRITEISKCISAGTYLSAVIMIGSVLEGLLLGVASKNSEQFNKSSAAPRDSRTDKIRKFHDWTLSNFIDCAYEVGALQEDVKKFSQITRDYRNYIHPYQQMRSQFSPTKETADICFQVLKAAISQVSKYKPKMND